MRDRLDVSRMVKSCRLCHLAPPNCNSPVPMVANSGNVNIVMVGEAPGKDEDRVGVPFVGMAGQRMKRMMRVVGIEPDKVGWVNVVSCWPHGTPDKKSIEICRVNLEEQLKSLSPNYIMALGNIAASSLLNEEVRIGDVRGEWRTIPWLNDCYVIATYHPASVLRNPIHEQYVKMDLESLRFYSFNIFDPDVGGSVKVKSRQTDLWGGEVVVDGKKKRRGRVKR